MKIALLHPNDDKRYSHLSMGYGSRGRPPETALAVLDSYQKANAKEKHDLIVLNPNKTNSELINKISNYNLVGMSDWYSNHYNCTDIAKQVKKINPEIKIVLGGPNATLTASQTMANHPYIDYIISRDGAETFTKLLDGDNPATIQNLWYRERDKITEPKNKKRDNLNKIPLWDFKNFEDADERLESYLEMIAKKNYNPWETAPISIFSFMGCIKAMRKNEGPCKFCYADNTGSMMSPENFWRQNSHLDKLYAQGIKKIVYMGDDILTLSPARIRQLAESKPSGLEIGIRGYGYLPDLAKLKTPVLEKIAKNLETIGVFNLFYGSESYSEKILKAINKKGVSVKDAVRVMKTMYEYGGVKTTMAYLIGYSGETKETLQKNIDSLKTFAKLGKILERLYYSQALPLKGSLWCKELEANSKVTFEYFKKTKKNLIEDDYVDYNVLGDLVLKHTTAITKKDLEKYINEIHCASENRPQGGFFLENFEK